MKQLPLQWHGAIRVKKSVSGILALVCTFAAWLSFALVFVWWEDPLTSAGAMVSALYFAAGGAAVALLGIMVRAVLTRGRSERLEATIRLGRIALYVSVLSLVAFIAIFYFIVTMTD
jgi:hypothetical protein